MAADYKLPLTIHKNVRFFDGQFLQDQDFVDEQKYHLSWQNRHHRLLHVSGVVEGLTVYIPANSTLQVKVRPGMAIDADGRQILLADYSTPVDLESSSKPTDFWLYIAYHQVPDDPSATDKGVKEDTRWVQKPYIFAHAGNDPLGIDDKDFGSPDWNGYLNQTDGPPPPVLLAKVTAAEDNSISIDESVRRYSGLRLPGPNTAAPMLRTDPNGNVGFWLVHNNDIVERITVTPQGRLGVGITTPQTELEVRGVVRGANNASNYTELGHGGSHGYVKMAGAGRLDFRHGDNTNMTLSADAKLGVGIGSFNPTSVLHIKSSAANDGLIIQTGDNSIDQGIAFRNSGNAYTWHLFRRQIGNGSTANLHIAAGLDQDITALSTVATFTPNGNVGIGTAPDAGALLDVAGTVRFRGSLQTSTIGRIDPFYIRGTGQNHNGNRRLMIGNTAVYDGGGRGLTLTIISKTAHSVISSTNYDVYNSEDASNEMAAAMNGITRDQIGVITSYDTWIRKMTDELRAAMQRVGLYKGASANGGHRSPYAAIFEAANTNGSATAIEVLYSDDGNNPHAEIRGWLMDGGFMATGAIPNALTSPEGNDAAVTVAQNGNVGIGTTSPTAKLEVNGAIRATQGQYMDVKSTAKLNAAGWHRIVQSPDNAGHNAGIFEIRWSVPSRHGHVRFSVGANFGDDGGAQLTVLDQSSYGGKIVETIRLLMKDTYDPHYVEFYFNGSGNDVIFNIYQLSGYGWSLVEPSAGAVPSGYSSHEIRANVLFATRSGADNSNFVIENGGQLRYKNQDFFSVTGTANHDDTISPPNGTSKSDWNIFVSPRDMGVDEGGSDKDNAFLRIQCWVDSNWKVHARYRFRYSEGTGSWYGGSVNYLLVPK